MVTIFVLVAAILLWLIGGSMSRYSHAVTQSMNRSVAMYVSNESQLIANGVANTDALQQLAHHAMIINPAIEVYLLDKKGRILSYDLPDAQVVIDKVNLKPIKTFLEPSAKLPILGDDPRSQDAQKVFSAFEVRFQDRLEGYVYIILEGHKQSLLENSILNSHVFQFSALALIACMAFGVLAALIIFSRFTRRIQRMANQVDHFYASESNEVVDSEGKDELERLEAAFEDMQARIEHQLEHIRQSDDMRRELIANISHDLRTPLTNMQGYIDTLLLKQTELSQLQQKQYLEITRNHGIRLGRLIADLFELAKLDSSGVKPLMENFSVAELVHDVVQDFAIRANNKNVKLSVSGDLDDAKVTADIRLMERVMENLLDNALRHTPSGGGVHVTIVRQPSGVKVMITDTGEGISPEDLPHVFDRFFHVRDREFDSAKSTGLGLAIVKRILDLHVFPIKVQSRLHEGTTFEFVLMG